MTDVARRHVLYIPGFDPVPPRAYRERYRREAARQAALSGFESEAAKTPKGLRFGWRVSARMEGADLDKERMESASLYGAPMKTADVRGAAREAAATVKHARVRTEARKKLLRALRARLA